MSKETQSTRIDPEKNMRLEWHAARALGRKTKDGIPEFEGLEPGARRAAITNPETNFREGDEMRDEILRALDRLEQQSPVGSEGEPESVELDPRLTTFKADFDADSNLKSKISWTEIQNRLLANESRYLILAQEMEQGGQLFGIDAKGNPLISDRGDEPIMKGMNYKMTRDRVLWKHTSLDRSGEMVMDDDKKKISTGYEMFPYVKPLDKSSEILQYESHTGKSFVKSLEGAEFRSSWVESGENPESPRVVDFYPRYGYADVNRDNPQAEFYTRGVRRLLRVKKA